MDVGETIGLDLVITHNGVKVLECLCGTNIWRIECCPPKSSSCCLTLQKDAKHYYKIISKQTYCDIRAPCYVGYYFTSNGVSIELHKFWFCHDDLLRCVGGTSRKYALDRQVLPSLSHVQAKTNFDQIKVVALEEASFLLSEKSRCPLVNQVGDDNSTSVNQPSTCAPLNFFGNDPSTHL